ncbi:MAG: heparinase II/III family protein [Candidatus Thiodiazotropha sp. (ex Monitilora ramsayi)]|nr:heparinase II/III family protein [Candidatus Thiodiazotropha sp. (ex Monitilora ramsayi)]
MKSLVWKINRIKAMSPWEILFRIWRTLNTKVEKRKVLMGWSPKPSASVKSGPSLFSADRNEILSEWKERFGGINFQLIESLTEEIPVFSQYKIDTSKNIDWHRDPDTGIRAPMIFGKDIDYRDNELVGNCKTLWEVSRHKHLVPLALGYAVTGQDKYIKAITQQVDGWIEQNPYGLGVNWCSSLEVALRLIAWCFTHHLVGLRQQGGLLAIVENADRLEESIYQHVYFIINYLSRFSSANNHLIGELTGVWVGCKAFDLGDAGSKWADYAKKQLIKEANKQVFNDGVSKEQATYYHLWVNEYLLLNWLIGIRYSDEFGSEFSLRIYRMYRYLCDLKPEGGEIPQIGDSDDGYVVDFHIDNTNDPYSGLFGAMESIKEGNLTTENIILQKSFWYKAIYGEKQPPQSWTSEEEGVDKKFVVYRQGGYCISKSSQFRLVFDTGPLGYPSIAAHGHADALSFILAYKGRWWLVDPGTYCYHTQEEWRNYFRGTSCHNTMLIDNADQCEIGGAFLWLRKSKVQFVNSSEKSDCVSMVGQVKGYNTDAVHQRLIEVNTEQCSVVIKDEVLGVAKTAELNFHFHPDIDISWNEEKGNFYLENRETGDCLNFIVDEKLQWKLYKGASEVRAGWFSDKLDKKVPAYTLRGTIRNYSDKNDPIITKIHG